MLPGRCLLQGILLCLVLLCLIVHRVHPFIELLGVHKPPEVDLSRTCIAHLRLSWNCVLGAGTAGATEDANATDCADVHMS